MSDRTSGPARIAPLHTFRCPHEHCHWHTSSVLESAAERAIEVHLATCQNRSPLRGRPAVAWPESIVVWSRPEPLTA